MFPTDPPAEVWVIDCEFQSNAGSRPFVVCLCGVELYSNRRIRLFHDELLSMRHPPFGVGKDTALVAFFSSAEFSCFLQLGWPLPERIVDLFAEHRALTNGRNLLHPKPNSLLGAAALHGIPQYGRR